MSTPTTITDEKKNVAKIVDRGLVVTQNSVPAPAPSEFLQVPFVRSMAVNGTGETELSNVDGSTTSVDAFIEARADGDLYLEIANLFIEGSGNLQLEDFGNITGGLTNGIDTFVESKGTKIPITQVPIKTNLEMVRIGHLTPQLGVDASAFRGKQSQGGGNTFYNPVWDLTKLSSGDEGIVLAAGTKQRLGITINDDLTPLASFNVLIVGYLRLIRA